MQKKSTTFVWHKSSGFVCQ